MWLLRDFPGGPVVKTPRFHCRGLGFNQGSWILSLVRELRSHMPGSEAKKKKKKNGNLKAFQKFTFKQVNIFHIDYIQ